MNEKSRRDGRIVDEENAAPKPRRGGMIRREVGTLVADIKNEQDCSCPLANWVPIFINRFYCEVACLFKYSRAASKNSRAWLIMLETTAASRKLST